MSFAFAVGPFDQDNADAAIDAAAEATAVDPGGDGVLLDYAVRLVKQIVAAAPIVSTHLVATINGHANLNGMVYQPGLGRPPFLMIVVGAPAEALPEALPTDAPAAQPAAQLVPVEAIPAGTVAIL